MPNQPTILVKKADGSQVRLTMEEFRRFQEERGKREEGRGKSEEIKKLGNLETEKLNAVKDNLPVKAQIESLATSAPVKEIWVDEAKYMRNTKNTRPPCYAKRCGQAKLSHHSGIPSSTAGRTTKKNNDFKWSAEDHRSLLEEKDEEVKQKPAAVSLPAAHDDVFAQVVKELKFPISDEMQPRLQSLIISRVKDIRSDEQVKEYALRQTSVGGLGLNAAQAEELLATMRKVLRLPVTSKLGGERKIKASSKPVIKSFSNSVGQLSNKPVTHSANNVAANEIGINKPINYSTNKPIINDITPAMTGKRTVGPVEELGGMTVIDFRRLAADPSVAGKILLEKFKESESESYLLYLEAIKAWWQSPLYRQYLAALSEAINRRQRISALLAGGGREQLKENEFMALVEVNGHLIT